jgi:membrane protease YdiL (CAAX protease family)
MWLSVAVAGIPVTVGVVIAYFASLQAGLGTDFADPLEEAMRDPSNSLPLIIVAVGIFPGFFEELGFRGWMQSSWRRVVSPRRALVLSACVFSVIHFSYYSLGWLLPMGLYLGWLRERSGSIWPGVVAHMGHNTAMVLLVRLGATG